MIALALVGCVGEGREHLVFPVVFHGSDEPVAVGGGELALDEAAVVIADLRFEGAPTAAAWLPSLVPSARAHPGHDFAGDVRAELLGTWTLDLTGGPQELGLALAYEGDLATASFQLAGEPTLAVRGTWTGPDGALPVDLRLASDHVVSGVPVVAELDAHTPPTVALRADLRHALSFLAWQDLDGDGALTSADGDAANTALFGLASTPTWAFAPEETP